MPIQTLEYECTPSSLLASSPCLACISEKEMLAVIVGIVAINTEQEIADIMKASACFTCMSKKQMLQALVTVLGNQLLGEETSAEEVVEDIKCLQCASEKQLLAAILYQFCSTFTLSGSTQ
jgi:hypothetical protein